MTENEEFIFESIFNQVRMGFVSVSEIKDTIFEEIEDNGFEDEISEEWASEIIDKEYNKLKSESQNWNKPTDTEKLIEAFDELCKENIIALHNAGFENSDGEYEVSEVEKALNKQKIASYGYCFYHEQDLSRAVSIENPSLFISFQKINNTDSNVTLEIGRKIVKILADKGLDIEWDEDVNQKILIKNFKWQYLYYEDKRDLQDYNDVIGLIINKELPTEGSKFASDFYLETDEIDNNNPTWTDINTAIEGLKYDEEEPSFIVLDLKEPIHNIMYIQAIINEDHSFDIELRTGTKDNFKHYRYNLKDRNLITEKFKKLYHREILEYSTWADVTTEFLEP